MSDIKQQLENAIAMYQYSGVMQDFYNLCKDAANHIAQQEALIAELHTSIAGAVQHGEHGWQRYESANKMCLNQQNEIAGLNEVIAELRKDAESTLIIALPVYEKRRIVIGSDELIDGERIVCVAIVDPDTSTQEVG